MTREYDYGIRIIKALAQGEKKQVEAICTEQLIPRPFAYKILKKLERAGFVQGHRGCTGGYRIVKPPGEITIYDIAVAIDEKLFVMVCQQKDYDCHFKKDDPVCRIHQEFNRIQHILLDEMKSKSIEYLTGGSV